MRLTLELAAYHWGEVLVRFGVDLSDAEADWPHDAYVLLERELTNQQNPSYRRALELTLATADPDRHDTVQPLLALTVDFQAVAIALAEFSVAQRMEQTRAEMLGEVLGLIDVALAAIGPSS